MKNRVELEKEAHLMWVQYMEENQGDAESGPGHPKFSENDFLNGLIENEHFKQGRNGGE